MALTSDKNNLTRRNKNGSLENKKDKAEEKKHVPDEHDSDHDGGDKKQTASEVDNEDVSNRSLLGFMLKRRHLVAALLALLASMVTTEVDPKTWQHEETGTFHRGRVEMFNYITDIQQIPEFCPIFSNIMELDRTPLSIGKKFKAQTTLPINLLSEFEVTEFVRYSRVVVASSCYLKPIISVEITRAENLRSNVTIAVFYNRKSLLFQYTLAPVLKFLTAEQIKHSMFVIKWLLPQRMT